MGGQGGREGVTSGGRGHGRPLAQEDGPGFLLHRLVGVGGGVGRGDREGGVTNGD